MNCSMVPYFEKAVTIDENSNIKCTYLILEKLEINLKVTPGPFELDNLI